MVPKHIQLCAASLTVTLTLEDREAEAPAEKEFESLRGHAMGLINWKGAQAAGAVGAGLRTEQGCRRARGLGELPEVILPGV